MADRTLTQAGVINLALERFAERMRNSTVGRVESYDATFQRVNVQPLIKNRTTGPDGEVLVERGQVVSNVPLVFQGAGDWAITFPVSVGDIVLLIFGDQSYDVWLSEGGEVDPLDTRRHHVSDAIAIPGLRSFKDPLTGVDTVHMVLGKPGASSDFVALAASVKAEIQTLRDEYAAHGHNVTTAGSAAAQLGVSGPPATALAFSPTPPLVPQVVAAVGDVGSSTVKVSE